ncbi:MAG: DUF542 domain-containing protein [Phycisphaeraceae bacterium]|nr:DUF542 domain-containing protein [Phycisphaerae bacterium]MBX3391692.1 DUF542 domain-containing protein [Phycisphaeraceae bacterium]HRJ48961.1 DUF542 domain-containing protein [Phycisphaerales bacterium]
MNPTLDSNASVGGLAVSRPDLIPVFDRLGIDYCCHGGESLSQACRRAGVEILDIIGAASEPAPDATVNTPSEPDPAAMTMSQLCEHIEAVHHIRAREIFESLGPLVDRVVSAHGHSDPRYAELAAVITQLREEMIDHMVREERVLFPWLRRLEQAGAIHIGPPWSVRRPIDCMVHDHQSVAEGFARIRAITRDYTTPAGACGSVVALLTILREFEADTRHHIHKENNILFPAGIRAEAGASQRHEMGNVLDPDGTCSQAEGGTCHGVTRP